MADSTRLTKVGCVGVGMIVLLALAVAALWTCMEKIPADRVGVRTLLTQSGVEEIDHPPGYVLAIPGFHVVRLWNPAWTNLKETLQVRGSDQYTTQIDISILVRIQKGKCHVVATHYRDQDHIHQLARNALNKFANEILAQMKTEDFYNSQARNQKAHEAQLAMDEKLKSDGLEVKNVLIRNIVYDPKFEQQLLQKQLAGQRKSLEIAKGQLAGAQTQGELIKSNAQAEVKQIDENKRQEIENLNADTERKIAQMNKDAKLDADAILAKTTAIRDQTKAEAEFKVEQMIQDAKLEASTIIAKAESTKRQKLAQAELLKATAAATGTAALSRAYGKPGASYYFARQAIEGMRLGEIEMNSNKFNPLDMETLLKALGLDLRALPASNSALSTPEPSVKIQP